MSGDSGLSENGDLSLPRTIGIGGSTLLSFNGVVGAAIFALPATLLVDWGMFSPWVFVVVGATALLVVVPFARSAAAFNESGGPATYGLVYGRLVGFELGWIYFVAKTAAVAANLNVVADYTARWWTNAGHGTGRVFTIVAVCAALAAINIFGMRRALAALTGFTLLKVLPLVIVGVAAIYLFGPPPAPSLPLGSNTVEAGFLVVFYSFAGFENAVVPTGETQEPQKTLPRAIVLTIIVTALVYFTVQLGFVSAFHAAPHQSTSPLIDLGSMVAGPLGAILLTTAALCSLLGNLLAASASTPRVTYAMGKRGDLPGWFSTVHSRLQSPANSILFLTTIAALLAISGSFVWLAVVSTLARMMIYPLTIAALPLAPQHPRLKASHWVTGAAGIAICSWGMTQADTRSWITLIVLSAIGILLYGVATLSVKRDTARAGTG